VTHSNFVLVGYVWYRRPSGTCTCNSLARIGYCSRQTRDIIFIIKRHEARQGVVSCRLILNSSGPYKDQPIMIVKRRQPQQEPQQQQQQQQGNPGLGQPKPDQPKPQQQQSLSSSRSSISLRLLILLILLLILLHINHHGFIIRWLSSRPPTAANEWENALWRGDVLTETNYHSRKNTASSTSATSTSSTVSTSSTTSTTRKIHLVVSHCNGPIDWIFESFAAETEVQFVFANITIISKCNQPVVSSVKNNNYIANATIVRLPNVGRCDHSYAWFLARNYDQLLTLAAAEEENDDDDPSVLLFLKDNDNHHRNMYSRQRPLDQLLQIASNDLVHDKDNQSPYSYGFACHEERYWFVDQDSRSVCWSSYFHDLELVRNFSSQKYERLRRDDNTQFASSQFQTLGDWWDNITTPSSFQDDDSNATTSTSTSTTTPNDARASSSSSSSAIVPVCYGGNFLFLTQQLRHVPQQVFQRMTTSLARGNNIVEGHYAERTWARLLSNPLKNHPTLLESLRRQQHEGAKRHCHHEHFPGVLTK
jgi:hypothetical protein